MTRISKRLAELGIGSRRDCEKLILDGEVFINGERITDLSTVISEDDKISVSGKKVLNKNNDVKIFLMNKPTGYITTTDDPAGRPTVFDIIPKKFGRLMSIGRLDMNTEGLLLLTNSGEAARLMELPITGVKRIYRVRVFGKIDDTKLKRLESGVTINGIKYGKFTVTPLKVGENNSWLRVIIFEGKNREVRRVMEHVGLRVTRLIRTQYGPYKLSSDIPLGSVVESKIPFDTEYYQNLMEKNKKFREKIRNKPKEKQKSEHAEPEKKKNFIHRVYKPETNTSSQERTRNGRERDYRNDKPRVRSTNSDRNDRNYRDSKDTRRTSRHNDRNRHGGSQEYKRSRR